MNNDNAHYNLKLVRSIIFIVLGALCVAAGVVIILTAPFALSITGLVMGGILCGIGGFAIIFFFIRLIYLATTLAQNTEYKPIYNEESLKVKNEAFLEEERKEDLPEKEKKIKGKLETKEDIKKILSEFCMDKVWCEVVIEPIINKEDVVLEKRQGVIYLSDLNKKDAQTLVSVFQEISDQYLDNNRSICKFRIDRRPGQKWNIVFDQEAFEIAEEKILLAKEEKNSEHSHFTSGKELTYLNSKQNEENIKMELEIPNPYMKSMLIKIIKRNDVEGQSINLVENEVNVGVKQHYSKRTSKEVWVVEISIKSEYEQRRQEIKVAIEKSMKNINMRFESRKNTIRVSLREYQGKYCNMQMERANFNFKH